MKNKKKLLSIILVFALMLSTFTTAMFSTSAATDENGCYVPSEGVGDTNRYYFYMPEEWKNEFTTDVGAYWWSGWDACGAVDGSGGTTVWPGYKAQKDKNIENLYYMDISTDVGVIIWNNYLDGGENTTAPIFTKAVQTVNLMASFYSEGDAELFDNLDDGMFFANMEESLLGDKEALGDFADNFFIDPDWGISFNFNNMIYIVNDDLTVENPNNGKLTYNGEWHFYYGDGTYGPYPTKEASIKEGLLGMLDGNTMETNPTSPSNEPATAPVTPEGKQYIYFDVNSTGWSNVSTVYCHIWAADGVTQPSLGDYWPSWQSKAEKCEFDKATGIATYDLSKTGHEFKESDGNKYCVIFSVNTGMQIYKTIMSGSCIGDILYCTGTQFENPEDSDKKTTEAAWRNNPNCGPVKTITSTGKIIGTVYPEGMTDESLVAQYLVRYYMDPAKTELTQHLINKLKVKPVDVMDEVFKFTSDIYVIKEIASIIEDCTDPTIDGNYYDWNFDEDGTLYIYGSGIINESGIYSAPWYRESELIKNVVIDEGITGIGNYSFENCTNLTSITIPESVTSIGESAFEGCTSLESITIPKSVTSIGDSAFAWCISLTSISIPNGVEYIENGMFEWCRNLTSISIPKSVTSIGYSAFNYCTNLTDVYYEGSEEEWNKINIDSYNEYLSKATIHYNSSAETPEYMLGDVNNDKVISVLDATEIQKSLVGMSILTESQKTLADVNNDGIMSVLDATEIQKYLVGMSPSFNK